MTRITLCSECDFVEPASRKGSPHRWLCTKFPRAEGMGFVAPNYWAEHEPYMRCVGINGGFCCCFKAARTAQTEMDVENG